MQSPVRRASESLNFGGGFGMVLNTITNIFPTLWSRYYYAHSIDEETEIERDEKRMCPENKYFSVYDTWVFLNFSEPQTTCNAC